MDLHPQWSERSVAVWKGNIPAASASPPSIISNQQSSIINPTLLQETSYQYDALNRYTLISVNDEPKVHYDYDPKTLRLEKKRYWNGWVVAYEHFEDGHPKSIVATDDKGKTITDCHYIWAKNGKLDQRILNGIHHQYRYDPLGRLTEVNKTKAP